MRLIIKQSLEAEYSRVTQNNNFRAQTVYFLFVCNRGGAYYSSTAFDPIIMRVIIKQSLEAEYLG